MSNEELLDNISLDTDTSQPNSNLTIWHPDEPGVMIELEYIGPTRALQLLGANHAGQRRIAVPTVNKYAADMVEGSWSFAGDPIRVDVDGHLIDGQHRLHSIIEGGVGQWMLVVSGLPNKTMLALDTGKKRSLSNQLSMLHFRKTGEKLKNSLQVAALCTRMFYWHGGNYGCDNMARVPNPKVGRDQPSHSQLIAIKDQYEKEYGITFEQAAGVGLASAGKRPGIYSTNYALLWTLLSGRNKDLREQFFFELMCEDPDVVMSPAMNGFKNRMLRRGKHEVWANWLQLHFLIMCAVAMGNNQESPTYRTPKVERWEFLAKLEDVPFGEAEIAEMAKEAQL